MEHDCAAGPKLRGQPPHQRFRVRLELQDVAANDRVERLLERHLGGIAQPERHVRERPLGRGLLGSCDRRIRAIAADHLPAATHELHGQKGDVTHAAADVEHTHARPDPGRAQKPAGDRRDGARLVGQAPQLLVGVPQHIRVGGYCDFTYSM